VSERAALLAASIELRHIKGGHLHPSNAVVTICMQKPTSAQPFSSALDMHRVIIIGAGKQISSCGTTLLVDLLASKGCSPQVPDYSAAA
jgi:hypothetical protein